MFKRNRYYNGKLLTEESFRTEQNYTSEKTALILRLFLGGGIISGFSTSPVYPDTLEVGAGTGIDENGNILLLKENKLLAVRTISGYSGSANSQILKVLYSEKPVDGSTEYIEEYCGFTFYGSGINIAEITFENGEIKDIRDLRKTENSYLYKNLYKNISSHIEKRLREEQKNATENLNREIRELKKLLSETAEQIPHNIVKSGTVTVKQGKYIYTDEIFHRLKKTPSYITFGIETKSRLLDARVNEIIYGDGELFEEYRRDNPVAVKKAVRIFPERGSFILALKLLKPIQDAELKLRWFAVFAAKENEI